MITIPEVDHCIICGHPAAEPYACAVCREDEAREEAEAGEEA